MAHSYVTVVGKFLWLMGRVLCVFSSVRREVVCSAETFAQKAKDAAGKFAAGLAATAMVAG
eukprot:scaffold54395_cov38-Prasinocladus_malaysianus.AAC.1